MVSSSAVSGPAAGLHLDALPRVTKNAFLRFSKISFFSNHGWYLAGGTALALQTGHRQSVDLDFFTPQKSFDERIAEETLSAAGAWKTSSLSQGTLYGEFNGAKISFISYPLFRVDKPFLTTGTISTVRPPDIAAMKIVAISQRGKKRDFFDLYWISLNIQPLFESIQAAEKQYAVRHNMNHILKSLVYFEDAEGDPDPHIYFDATWTQVKKYFVREVPIIAKKVIR